MTCCLGADRPTIHDTISLLLLQPHLMNMQFVTSREQRFVDIFATACFAPSPNSSDMGAGGGFRPCSTICVRVLCVCSSPPQDMRTSIGQERLNGLALLHVHYTRNIDINENMLVD